MANKLTNNAGQKSSQTNIQDYNAFAMRNVRPPINIYLHDDIIRVQKCEFPITISGKPVGYRADKNNRKQPCTLYYYTRRI